MGEVMAEDTIIPVIDFEKCGLYVDRASTDDLTEVGEMLKNAFNSVGFCYLKNHGIEADVLDNYRWLSKQFFDQPTETKQKYARGNDCNFGWVAVERESVNPERPGDLKEAFNFCPGDDTGIWPTVEFQQATRAVFDRFEKLAYRVCDAFCVGLGADKNLMRDAHRLTGKRGNGSTLRSLYYPPLTKDSKIKPNQIRLGEHSDYGTVTLVHQDDIGGLELNVPGKGYLPVPPIPGTLVVNVGDLMQRWTADRLVAAKHRILIPEAEIKKRTPRQSVAFFLYPDDDYVVKCFDGSDKYEPITGLDYLKCRFSVTY